MNLRTTIALPATRRDTPVPAPSPSPRAPRRADVRLKIRLGEMVLANPVVRAMVMDCDPFARERQAWPLRQLRDLPGDVDAAFLPSWPLAAGEALPEVPGLWRYVPARYRRYCIDLGMGFDAYMATFSGKSRSTLKRKVRRFRDAAGGGLDVREYATPEAMPEFHALARMLSEQTYQHRLMDAGMPGGAAFREELVARAAEGRARGFVLMMQGCPAAYMYCPVDDGVVAYERVGYAPGLRHLSPGTVLFQHAIAALFATPGLAVFDFTEGEGEHKEFFATGCVECADIYYLRRNLRALVPVTAQRTTAAGSRAAAAALDALAVKPLAKRLLRRLGRNPLSSDRNGTSS